MRDELHRHGYDKEAEYVYKHNKELLEKKKKELEMQQHWMKCPKCGCDMNEVLLNGVPVDQCKDCHGIYLDADEIELLIKKKEEQSLFDGVGELFP